MTSGQRQIARATIVVMVAFIVSRLLGLVRQAVIGEQFGLSVELDAYFAAFRIPDFLFNIVAGGALSSAFIPTFAGYLARDDRAGAWRMASAIATWMTVALSSAAALAAVFAPQLVDVLFASDAIPPAQRLLTVDLLRIMLLATVIFGVSGLVMAALNAMQHFMMPALAPVLYNVGIIAGALFLSRTMGVYGLAWGVVAGAVLHLLIQLPVLWRFGVRYRPTLGRAEPGVSEVARLMGPRVIGLAVVQINFLVETFLAAPLGPGSLSALTYAWQAMLLPQAVFAQATANAAFPTFADQVARGQTDALRQTLAATLRAVLFLALPATLGLILLRREFIALLLERGNFTAAATELVAWALLFHALGLAGHSGLEIITRAFYALHDTRTPVIAGMGSMALNVVLSLALIPVFRQAGGHPIGALGLANALATTLETVLLLWLLRRRLNGLEGTRLRQTLVRAGLAALAMAAVVYGWLLVLPPGTGFGHNLLAGGVGAALGGAVYWGVALALKTEEARTLPAPLLRRVFRRM